MLTLETGKKAFDEQDESQLFIRPKNMPVGLTHTFQVLSTEIALGYKVLTESENDKYMFVPIDIPGAGKYEAKAIIEKNIKKGVSRDKALFQTMSLVVWSYIHDSQKILDLSGASIRKLFDLLGSVDKPLQVKVLITKEAGTPPSYTVTLRNADNGKPEIFPVKKLTRPMHPTNLFFGASVFDAPCKLEDFVALV
ncbi:MAG: hypothetical protein ACRC6D_00865 [Aeromonas sp.]